MIRKFVNQQGFTLVQAMILAGIMAAGALVMTRTITDLKLTQKGAESRDDLETFHSTIVSALQDSAHCTATQLGNPTQQIRLASGDVIAEVGQTYMNGNIRVDAIIPVASPSPYGSISIKYSRLKVEQGTKQGFGGKDILKKLPVNFVFERPNPSTDPVFSRCYLDEGLYNSETAEEFCLSLGTFMQWDAVNKRCSLKAHNCASQPGTVFAGIDSNGNEICQKITQAIVTKDMFGIGTVNCAGRSNLGLTVEGGQIVIKCNPGGCFPATPCSTIAAGYCPGAPTQSDSCGTNCGVGTKSCAPTLSWSPLAKDFGSVTVGSSSADQTFTLSNSSGSAATGCTAPTITDTTNFTLTPNGNCIGTNDVPGSGSCTVTIHGNPTSIGSKTTTLTRTCAVGGTASTTSNLIVVNGTTGGCTGYGGWSNAMFTNTTPDGGSCAATYRDQYFDVDPAKFRVGNIYSITRGRTVTEEVLAGDTITTMLNRLAAKINAGGNYAYGGCGAGRNNSATVSGNRITHRVYWQNSAIADGSYSCNIATQAACVATPGCNWDTTSANICKGWNFPDPQGVCNGTYNQPSCMYDGSGSGQDMNCRYSFDDSASCSASGMGCYWGSISQTCYGTDSASCTANAGCSWTSYPSNNRSCTSISDQTTCQSHSPNCTWGPP